MSSVLVSQLRDGLTRHQLRRALWDLYHGGRRDHLWITIGLQEIRQKYRRSMLGPFWITLSMGVMIFALGLLYGMIFRQDLSAYLPYLAAGFVSWGLIQALVLEGSNAFIAAEPMMRQLAAPTSIYCYRVVWSALLNFLHTIWIFFFVAILFGSPVNAMWLWGLPALALILINGVWIGLLLGLLSARFRDVPLIVTNVVQVMFFITPIIWRPDMIPQRIVLLDWNPFYHLVAILRNALLGQPPAWENWLVVLGITVAGWGLALFFYTVYRWRIVYWV